MNLQCSIELAAKYRSPSQVVRVLTEDWCARELYCSACSSDNLRRAEPNTQAVDFYCPRCEQPYQLKSGKEWNSGKIVDAGYLAMIRAIREDRTPNLFVLQYSKEWMINNLLLIPRFFFSESVIERRKPLAESARRAGWVGCNILLGEIPQDGRIQIVSDSSVVSKKQVRAQFKEISGLADVRPDARGWTLDVLRIVRRLGRKDFALRQIYDHESELQELHPKNRNIRPKIRQQLQVLRSLGFVRFTAPGQYSVTEQ